MAPPASNNKKTTIYKVTANNTDMIRFVTADVDATDTKVIIRARAQLRSTEASSVGNASKRRMNPLWDFHRKRFLNATSFKVEAIDDVAVELPPDKRTQHVVMALNRKYLLLATMENVGSK